MDKVIGSCSNCGGDVVAHDGPWHAVVSPPPPRCVKCGATTPRNVIQMGPPAHPWSSRTGNAQAGRQGTGQGGAFLSGMQVLSETRKTETEYDRGYRDGVKSAKLEAASIPMAGWQNPE